MSLGMSGPGYPGMQAYLDRTSSELYRHFGLVCTHFNMFFMFQVASRATGYHFLVGAQTCSRWMHTLMACVGIDPKYKGGSIRIAAASAAINRDVPINVVLNTGRWASWQVFNRFYNRARLRDVAPSIGLTSLP